MKYLSRTKFIIFSLCLILSLSIMTGCGHTKTASNQQNLFVYVGANLRKPVSDLAASYQKATGIKVELTFNNSGALINQMETMKKGDIYIPGGMPFIKKAQQKNLIDKVLSPIAYHTPVIITPKNNPAHIKNIYDLANNNVKLVIPDEKATAIGKTIHKIFEKSGKNTAIEKNIIASLETPAKVSAAIGMGQGNAGIVELSNTVNNKDKITVIPIDPEINQREIIPIADLNCSKNKKTALDFMNYVKNNGPAVFKKYGFKIN